METMPLYIRLSWVVAIILFTLFGMWVLDEFFINVEQEVEYLQDG
jgi:hypothetical protein